MSCSSHVGTAPDDRLPWLAFLTVVLRPWSQIQDSELNYANNVLSTYLPIHWSLIILVFDIIYLLIPSLNNLIHMCNAMNSVSIDFSSYIPTCNVIWVQNVVSQIMGRI